MTQPLVSDECVPIGPSQFAALVGEVDLFVLDVHGVILNRPWTGFLQDIGHATGEGSDALVERWHRDLRLPFWEGRLDESGLWQSISPQRKPADLRADLEARFAPGPLFDTIVESDVAVSLLSNHRSDWLLTRLDRFGLDDRFEHIIVSDVVGAAKPSPVIFAEIEAIAADRHVCFIDDQQHNVDTARRLGFPARLAAQ